MRNPFAIEDDPHDPAPREIMGWRAYAIAVAATWVGRMQLSS